jgi:RNA polymerase sigma factor (sigma-70 family)
MDLIGAFIFTVVVALVGGLALDCIRGAAKRSEGKMARILQGISDEGERERWQEELRGLLLEHEGRPFRQYRESRELILAAQELVDFYRAEEARSLRLERNAEATELVAVDSPFSRAAGALTKEALKEALESLSYRERRILELLYGLGGEHPRSHDEVGRTFNVTAERIGEIEMQSLKKLQSLGEAQKLREIA